MAPAHPHAAAWSAANSRLISRARSADPKDMRTSTVALALLLLGCTSVQSTHTATDGEGHFVAVRSVQAEPTAGAAPKATATEPVRSAASRDESVARRPGVETSVDPGAAEGPATAEDRSHLGDLFARAGLIPEAITEYRISIELDPKNAVQHFKLGLAYQSMRRFEEALSSYQQAARLEPQSAWTHAAVAIVHAKMGQAEQALDAYRTVKELDAEMADGLLEVISQYGSFHEV
jgi:tetratricopeptide (TPR) repeat protein